MPSYWQNEQAFQDAVDKATQAATQKVAKTHRKRLMLSGGLVGIIAACIVAIPTSITLTNAQLDSAQQNRHVNCVLITKLAGVTKEESQEATDSSKEFKANSTSHLGLTAEKFDKLVKAGQERRERHLKAVEEVAHHNCNE